MPNRFWRFRRIIDELKEGLVLIVGCGASLIAWGHILVYADLGRWAARQRLRRNETGNLGADNKTAAVELKYKRAFFVDWRDADRWKRPLIRRWDHVLDTNNPAEPKLAEAGDVRSGMREAAMRPFRLAPIFDSAPWREAVAVDGNVENSEVCIDCAADDNSLLLGFGGVLFEIPALDLVFYQSRELLGEAVQLRFKDEFPIRFSFFDTTDSENSSFQVHPLAEYVKSKFGVRFPQDKSYYVVDTGAGASIRLGLRPNVQRAAVQSDFEDAHGQGERFPAEKYTSQIAARKHDHFLVPAGTVHDAGTNSVMLEIAAAPYIFTMQMGSRGGTTSNAESYATHLAHGLNNVQWERDVDWTKQNLVNRIEPVAIGDGWREEKVGSSETIVIETRRHWFTKKVLHNTNGSVNVLNLVQGEEAVVESPTAAFVPFVVHFAETFIVPASVGEYTVRPHGASVGKECATIKAFVRTDAWV